MSADSRHFLVVKVKGGDEAVRVLIDPQFAWLARWSWWLDDAHERRAGKRYVVRFTSVDGRFRRVYMHRVVLGLDAGDKRTGDHINGDTLDNRLSNLRIATTAQNAQNQGSRRGTSGYRGVSWDKSRQRWMASAMLNGHRKTLGRYTSELEAAEAAAAFRRAHMPFSQEALAAGGALVGADAPDSPQTTPDKERKGSRGAT